MSTSMFPSKQDIQNAHARITPFIHHTPVIRCSAIDNALQAEVYFKCENFQKVGAFKYRGATNAVLLLPEAKRRLGVAAHSSGNHAQALALAAKEQDIKAHIVMPNNAPKVKVAAVKGYGAEILFCEPTLQARESALEKVIESTGAVEIHPYDNDDIISGQASASKELISEKKDLDYILVPVGGGGLLSGTLLAAHYFSPNTKVIASEPSGADDTFQSIKQKKLIPSISSNTIADGLLTSLSQRTFNIISALVEDVVTVTDDEIISAMQLVWERMKIIIEPSSAVPLAVAFKKKELFQNKKVGIIISGGNVDLKNLPF